MAAELKSSSLISGLAFYLRNQAPSLIDYLLQGCLTLLFGWIPGLPGIALRGLFYGLMMRLDGMVAIEPHVRLRCARGIHLGKGVFLDQGVYLHATPGGIEIGDHSAVMHGTELHVFNFRGLPHAFIKVGRNTFIGESVIVRGQGGVEIGDSVLIAPGAKLLAVNHNFTDPTRPIIEQGISGQGIVVEQGAWIGSGAVVLDGVRVGRGSVVGANAVVTRDVPAYAVVVGSPARVVKRFGPDEAELRRNSMSGLGAQDLTVAPQLRRP